MMQKLHLALGVADIMATVADYTKRLGQEPDLVISGTDALWQTSQLNVSIRKTEGEEAGKLRHPGWETDDAWPDVLYEPDA